MVGNSDGRGGYMTDTYTPPPALSVSLDVHGPPSTDIPSPRAFRSFPSPYAPQQLAFPSQAPTCSKPLVCSAPIVPLLPPYAGLHDTTLHSGVRRQIYRGEASSERHLTTYHTQGPNLATRIVGCAVSFMPFSFSSGDLPWHVFYAVHSQGDYSNSDDSTEFVGGWG